MICFVLASKHALWCKNRSSLNKNCHLWWKSTQIELFCDLFNKLNTSIYGDCTYYRKPSFSMYLLSTPYPYVSKFCKFNFNFNYHCVVKSSVCTVTIGWSFVSLRLSFNDLMIVSDGSNKRLYDWSGVLDSSLCYCFLPIFSAILSSLSRSIYFYEIYCCLLIENMLNCIRFLLKRKENIGTVISIMISAVWNTYLWPKFWN